MRRTALWLVLVGALSLIAVRIPARAQDASGGGPTGGESAAAGQQLYEQICQACHMADAKGGEGAGAKIPPLAANPRLADPQYPVAVVLKGRGGMPSFSDLLTPAQIASVVTYVRSHFNHYSDPVTEADVKRIAANPPPLPE